MCKALRVDVYCNKEVHGKLPLGKDKSELSQDEKEILKRALVHQCRSAISCQRGKYCFVDRELEKTAEREENVVYMRWTGGHCWECTWNSTAKDNSIRSCESDRKEYLEITGQPVPAVGEGPLDSRIVDRYSKTHWSLQTEHFYEFWYDLEDVTERRNSRVDDLRDIFHKLTRGYASLKDIFTIADGVVTCHETGEKRVIGEAMPVVRDAPRLDREGENSHKHPRCNMCGWIEPYFP